MRWKPFFRPAFQNESAKKLKHTLLNLRDAYTLSPDTTLVFTKLEYFSKLDELVIENKLSSIHCPNALLAVIFARYFAHFNWLCNYGQSVGISSEQITELRRFPPDANFKQLVRDHIAETANEGASHASKHIYQNILQKYLRDSKLDAETFIHAEERIMEKVRVNENRDEYNAQTNRCRNYVNKSISSDLEQYTTRFDQWREKASLVSPLLLSIFIAPLFSGISLEVFKFYYLSPSPSDLQAPSSKQ